jgi:hypothetical protein
MTEFNLYYIFPAVSYGFGYFYFTSSVLRYINSKISQFCTCYTSLNHFNIALIFLGYFQLLNKYCSLSPISFYDGIYFVLDFLKSVTGSLLCFWLLEVGPSNKGWYDFLLRDVFSSFITGYKTQHIPNRSFNYIVFLCIELNSVYRFWGNNSHFGSSPG